jgi:hypothetical protein
LDIVVIPIKLVLHPRWPSGATRVPAIITLLIRNL